MVRTDQHQCLHPLVAVGSLAEQRAKRITGMLRVQEIMNTAVATCAGDANLEHVASLMWHRDCGAIPVVNVADEPVGIVTDRDIAMGAMLCRRSPRDLRVDDIKALGEIITCRGSDDVRDALKKMQRHQVRRLPVVDESGRLAGILSLRDIIGRAGKKQRAGVSCRDTVKALKRISR
jgi:CBS domain-containing protein